MHDSIDVLLQWSIQFDYTSQYCTEKRLSNLALNTLFSVFFFAGIILITLDVQTEPRWTEGDQDVTHYNVDFSKGLHVVRPGRSSGANFQSWPEEEPLIFMAHGSCTPPLKEVRICRFWEGLFTWPFQGPSHSYDWLHWQCFTTSSKFL